MLSQLTEDIWEVVDRVKIMPAFYLPCRMTVVRLSNGGLMLHSPVALDEQTALDIERLGPVEHIVAPNREHHLFLGQARERFPDARVFYAPGLESKHPELPPEGRLDSEVAGWPDELEWMRIEGASDWNEIVFFHRDSRTLICSDLLFNLHEFEGWLTPWMTQLFGTYRRLAHSKLWRSKYDDVEAFATSVVEMLDWPIERVVMAHGDVVEDDCRPRMDEAFAWLLDHVPAGENATSESRRSTA
jgi:hypothetical protein